MVLFLQNPKVLHITAGVMLFSNAWIILGPNWAINDLHLKKLLKLKHENDY